MAVALGLLSAGETKRLEELLALLGLATRPSGLDARAIYRQLSADKKTQHGKIRFVLPETIGRVVIRDDVPEQVVLKALA
jgi:3-dehydroquinate synthase